MTSIRNADLIRAVLDGKEVQKSIEDGRWFNYQHTPEDLITNLMWANSGEKFRIKPELVVVWVPSWAYTRGLPLSLGPARLEKEAGDDVSQWLRLEICPDTQKVLSVTVEKP